MAYFVYILASKPRGTLYIGVTNSLHRRLSEHQENLGSHFVKKYQLTHLVYAEEHPTIIEAITREKQLKNWRRDWKIKLIESINPTWNNLSQYLT